MKMVIGSNRSVITLNVNELNAPTTRHRLAVLGEAHWLKLPTLATHVVTICMSYFMTGGSTKEQGTNKPPQIIRVRKRSKWDTTCPTISQNPPSWLSNACATRKDSESEWLGKDNPETNPITVTPEAARRAVLLGSLTLLLSDRPSLPNETSYFVSACFSSDKRPLLGPGRGCPSCSIWVDEKMCLYALPLTASLCLTLPQTICDDFTLLIMSH